MITKIKNANIQHLSNLSFENWKKIYNAKTLGPNHPPIR